MSFYTVLHRSKDPELERLPKALQNMEFLWKRLYRRYLELVRVLQEHGIPAKPLDPEEFKKNLGIGHFGTCSYDTSGFSTKIAKKDLRKALFAALAADILVSYLSEGGCDIEKDDAGEYLEAEIDPEYFPRVVGEIYRRALLKSFKKINKVPPPGVEYLPEWMEEAAKVLEEFFEGDPHKVRKFILTGEDLPEEELRKMYSELIMRADNLLREWKERRARRVPPEAGKEVPVKKKAELVEVKELKPPKAVNIILTKLEAAREMAQWMGGVDIRALKKILYDVRERKKIVGEALRLVKEWERGNKDAFFEEYAHIKNLPEEELEEHKLIGDLERIRRKVAAGELTPTDAANILTALHTTYSVTESHLTDFLSRIEEHAMGREPRSLRIRPERLDKHVIKPLKEKLKRIRPIIKGKL